MARLQVKREFRLAEELARDLEKMFAITLPKDEIAYLAMHLLGAKLHYVPINMDQLTQTLDRVEKESIHLSQQLITKMEELTGLPLAQDKELLVGLTIHMQSAVHRIRHRLHVTNPILHDIKRAYRYMFEAVLLAVSMMEFDMEGRVSEDEAGYLTMHFQAAWERLKKHHVQPKKLLLVCTTGVGTSQLMAAKISRWFPSLTILGTIPASRLKQSLELLCPDLLISTAPLTESSIPVVHVSPLLGDRDRKNIQRAVMEEVSLTGSNRSGATVTLKSFIDPRMVWLNVDGEDRHQVIRFMAEQLIEAGFAEKGFAESAWEREQISSTYIGGGVATPHGAVDLVLQSTVAVARLNKPVDWQGKPVFLVIMPCVNWQDKETAERVYADLVELSENPVRLHALRKADCIEQFLNEL
jgi:activator of the mannose operon (transcriptional antiterminator)